MRFPPELLLLFAEDLAQFHAAASLACLSLTSSQIRELVTPILYRSISIHTNDSARAVRSTFWTNSLLAVHVQRVFLASSACGNADNVAEMFCFCLHLATVVLEVVDLRTASAVLIGLESAPALRRLAISRLDRWPLRTIRLLALTDVALKLLDFHVSGIDTTAPGDIVRTAPHELGAFARLRTFSCAYAVNVALSPGLVDQRLMEDLLPTCAAFAALPSVEHLGVFLHPPHAAGLVANSHFPVQLGLCARPRLRITLAAIEESELHSIIERQEGWSEIGHALLAQR